MTRKPIPLPTSFSKGDRVRVAGVSEQGTFVIMRSTPNPDGSWECYGGDADPGGYRKFRSLKGLTVEDRKPVLARLKRAEVEGK